MANVKSEWNCIKTFPDLSGTGFFSFYTYIYNLWLLVVSPLCFTYSALISGKASCVKFGPDAKYLAVGSMDRNLRIFGLPSEDGPLES